MKDGWYLCYCQDNEPILRFILDGQAWRADPREMIVGPEGEENDVESLKDVPGVNVWRGPLWQYSKVVPLPDWNTVAEACGCDAIPVDINQALVILDAITNSFDGGCITSEMAQLVRDIFVDFPGLRNHPDYNWSELMQTCNVPSVSMTLADAIANVESRHFRTEHDTGANPTAELVMNTFRDLAGLSYKGRHDLPKWNEERKAYIDSNGNPV